MDLTLNGQDGTNGENMNMPPKKAPSVDEG